VMMQYSLLDRRPEEACLPFLKDNSIGVLARGSVAKGLLVNKPAAEFLNYNQQQVQQAADAIHSVSGPSRNPAQSAIRFVLQHPAINTAVVGVSALQQLEEASATTNTPLLTQEQTNLLREAVPVNYYDQHR